MERQIRYQMLMPHWLKKEAKREAEKQGISLAEYIKDLMKRDIAQKSCPTSPSFKKGM